MLANKVLKWAMPFSWPFPYQVQMYKVWHPQQRCVSSAVAQVYPVGYPMATPVAAWKSKLYICKVNTCM